MKKIILACAVLVLGGCTTITLNPKFDRKVKPVYTDYADYYVGGLFGTMTFNVQKICMDQKPYAVQQALFASDAVITLFTLGIYSPRTIRVWCGD